ncbi:MAG: glycosyltransferase [Acidobacteriota bacterium]|nr:glycosyltransferase [Acidobacteriota bacterium]
MSDYAPRYAVTVAIPTLAADSMYLECIGSLRDQTFREFEVIVVDNSGKGLVRNSDAAKWGATVIEMDCNAGFGAAVNAAFRHARAPFFATLNDDAAASPGWLAALTNGMQQSPDIGMCASQVRLWGEPRLDSAGMLICGDGSSKQRGHGRPPDAFAARDEALLPSGSAALYRRAMLDQIGLFDEDFFLYCEDTDLGLRARWAGWRCAYVPEAVVMHRYSHSAGRASPLKAFYVERNRLFLAIKNFPGTMLATAPFISIARYFWHAVSLARGRGHAAEFRREHSAFYLIFLIVKAHIAAGSHLRALWRKRREIRRAARVSPSEYTLLLKRHAISARELAAF